MSDARDDVFETKLPSAYRQLRLGASVLTPFDESDRLNEDVFQAQIDRLSANGLDIWVASSGTAEGNVLSPEEVRRTTQIAVDHSGAGSHVYAMGAEPRSAKQAIEFSKVMSGLGVDAVQVGPLEPGHSYVPSEDELRSFYEEVFSETDAPTIVASHVSAGYEIPPETLAQIARDHADRVVGVTATHLQNNAYLPRLLEAVGDQFPVWTGSPLRAMDSCAIGAKGFTSSMDVNVAPELYAAFSAAWAGGDLVAVSAAYRAMLRLFQRVFSSGGIIISKAILVQLGLAYGTTRPPRRQAGAAEMAIAAEIIAEFGLRSI